MENTNIGLQFVKIDPDHPKNLKALNIEAQEQLYESSNPITIENYFNDDIKSEQISLNNGAKIMIIEVKKYHEENKQIKNILHLAQHILPLYLEEYEKIDISFSEFTVFQIIKDKTQKKFNLQVFLKVHNINKEDSVLLDEFIFSSLWTKITQKFQYEIETQYLDNSYINSVNNSLKYFLHLEKITKITSLKIKHHQEIIPIIERNFPQYKDIDIRFLKYTKGDKFFYHSFDYVFSKDRLPLQSQEEEEELKKQYPYGLQVYVPAGEEEDNGMISIDIKEKSAYISSPKNMHQRKLYRLVKAYLETHQEEIQCIKEVRIALNNPENLEKTKQFTKEFLTYFINSDQISLNLEKNQQEQPSKEQIEDFLNQIKEYVQNCKVLVLSYDVNPKFKENEYYFPIISKIRGDKLVRILMGPISRDEELSDYQEMAVYFQCFHYIYNKISIFNHFQLHMGLKEDNVNLWYPFIKMEKSGLFIENVQIDFLSWLNLEETSKINLDFLEEHISQEFQILKGPNQEYKFKNISLRIDFDKLEENHFNINNNNENDNNDNNNNDNNSEFEQVFLKQFLQKSFIKIIKELQEEKLEGIKVEFNLLDPYKHQLHIMEFSEQIHNLEIKNVNYIFVFYPEQDMFDYGDRFNISYQNHNKIQKCLILDQINASTVENFFFILSVSPQIEKTQQLEIGFEGYQNENILPKIYRLASLRHFLLQFENLNTLKIQETFLPFEDQKSLQIVQKIWNKNRRIKVFKLLKETEQIKKTFRKELLYDILETCY